MVTNSSQKPSLFPFLNLFFVIYYQLRNSNKGQIKTGMGRTKRTPQQYYARRTLLLVRHHRIKG
jgi:hypothetical protein